MASRVGVAIPCHVRDSEMCFRVVVPTLSRMKPAPYMTLIELNTGEYTDLKDLRTRLFDSLFYDHNCDVVLSVCTDYLIINRNLLNEVSLERVVNFGRFFTTPIIGFFFYLLRRCTNSPWSAMYSIPRDVWFNEVRDNPLWQGNDGDIPKCVKMNYEINYKVNYLLTRRNTKRIVDLSLENYRKDGSLLRFILKMLLGVKI